MEAARRDTPVPNWRYPELLAFTASLLALQVIYFHDALRPGWVLSAADWLLASESFGRPDFDPSNRLLTDIACQMEPWLKMAGEQWAAGRVPLWNPYSGCGAPLLANAQSGVLYPINLIPSLSSSPYALVAIAVAKMMIAGLGTFLLAGELSLGRLGRWFAGLSFPWSGFVVVWLQYPMGGVAVWLPLALWLADRLIEQPSPVRTVWLALVVATVLLGGHPETAAHILMILGIYSLWRQWTVSRPTKAADATSRYHILSKVYATSRYHILSKVYMGTRGLRSFGVAILVGMLLASVQLVPTVEYLERSQVWSERSRKVPEVFQWQWPDFGAMPALAMPYVYGSYQRGHVHVEKSLGVGNFNEIAGGYTGLATLAILVPVALRTRRLPWISFWIVLDLVALATVYHLPVCDNLLRLAPVLNVAQNQRLLLVVALAHCLLGAAGLEATAELGLAGLRRFRLGLVAGLVGGSLLVGLAAFGVRQFEERIRHHATEHFVEQARLRGLPQNALADRANQQALRVLEFFPRYYASVATYGLALAAFVASFGYVNWRYAPGALLALSLADLVCFGRGYNPAIPLQQYFPECSITEFLHAASRGTPVPFRVFPLEEEFPPNVLARYGIADLRNYDAIEHRDLLAFFGELWSAPGQRRTSTRWVTWEQVAAGLERLRLANVRFIISTKEPPPDLTCVRRVFQNGKVSVYEVPGASPFHVATTAAEDGAQDLVPLEVQVLAYEPGRVQAKLSLPESESRVVLSETAMPGWRCIVDGIITPVMTYQGAFLAVDVSKGTHSIEFEYCPRSLWLGGALSLLGGLAILFLLIPGAAPPVWGLLISSHTVAFDPASA